MSDSNDSTQNKPAAPVGLMNDVAGSDTPPKNAKAKKDGPVHNLRYIGTQLAVHTNLGRMDRGQVIGVGQDETSQSEARQLIANGQCEDAGDDAETGLSDEWKQKNADEAKKRAEETAAERAKSHATPAPLPRTPQQIQADAQAQQEADRAASKSKK